MDFSSLRHLQRTITFYLSSVTVKSNDIYAIFPEIGKIISDIFSVMSFIGILRFDFDFKLSICEILITILEEQL